MNNNYLSEAEQKSEYASFNAVHQVYALGGGKLHTHPMTQNGR